MLEAQCDRGGCGAVITNANEIQVIGFATGSFTLTVTAQLQDGTRLVDFVRMEFVTVDAIALACTRANACPGPNAVFPGSRFTWAAQPMSHGQVVEGVVSITPDQPGVVEVSGNSDRFEVRALKPGVVSLRLRSGHAERIQKIRVAAIEEVVAGTVRLRRALPCLPVVCVDADLDQLGDPAPQLLTTLAPAFVLAWALRDGTFAVGGAGRVTSTTPGVEVIVTGSYTRTPQDLELMSFTTRGEGSALCHRGQVHLAATIETAKLDWSFEQYCE